MSPALTMFIFAVMSSLGWAGTAVTIFEVRKNLPMSDSDPVYRDFYVNGGSEVGLTQGSILTVRRHLPLYDSYQNRSAGDLDLRVAKVKVIHVQRGLAVVRLHSEFTRDQSPLLEENFIMVGDLLDLDSASSDKSDKKTADSSDEAKAEPVASAKVSGQILVNSVELSSQAPPASPPVVAPPVPDKIDVPVLQ
jgi:hypothetical protein